MTQTHLGFGERCEGVTFHAGKVCVDVGQRPLRLGEELKTEQGDLLTSIEPKQHVMTSHPVALTVSTLESSRIKNSSFPAMTRNAWPCIPMDCPYFQPDFVT